MDIRDINMAPFDSLWEVHKGRAVEAVFEWQEDLLNEYVKIEKIPQWPIDINSPTNQILLKDFIARVTEELGEGFESYLKLYSYIMRQPSDFIEYQLTDNLEHPLFNFNEEIADAIHFLTEACIMVGIKPLTLYTLDSLLGEEVTGLYNYVRPAGVDYQGFSLDRVRVLDNKGYLLTEGGRRFSPAIKAQMALQMWNVTYFLQLARNALKNKPWKQTQMLSDNQVFKHAMAEAYHELVALCRLSGMTEKNFLAIYWAKNQINKFRIASRY